MSQPGRTRNVLTRRGITTEAALREAWPDIQRGRVAGLGPCAIGDIGRALDDRAQLEFLLIDEARRPLQSAASGGPAPSLEERVARLELALAQVGFILADFSIATPQMQRHMSELIGQKKAATTEP